MLPPPTIVNRIKRNPATTKSADLEFIREGGVFSSSGATGISVYPVTDYADTVVVAAVLRKAEEWSSRSSALYKEKDSRVQTKRGFCINGKFKL